MKSNGQAVNTSSTFTPPTPLKTAVLFLVFNRPEVTAQVFEAIRQAKPPRLYVAADGPRSNRPGEAERCAEVRRIVTSVDWPCEVKTLFRESNLGCKMGVSGGINWFFEHEEEGIILEDDCLPSQSFFWFCEELLERYRGDNRVSQISGVNFQFGYKANDDSYYFSRYSHIWGWATWRDRWLAYDVSIAIWPKIKHGYLPALFQIKDEMSHFEKIYQNVFDGLIDTWDYQWGFANRLNGRSSVIPQINLIRNIGFGPDATHTAGEGGLSNIPCLDMQLPLRHPLGVFPSNDLDQRYFMNLVQPPLYRRLVRKIKRKLQIGG